MKGQSQKAKGTRQKWTSAVGLLVGLVCSTASMAQVAQEANSGYRTKEARAGVAQSLGAADRDATQKPQELVDALALRPGMVVADIGTGVGYMLPYLSKAVGPEGRVLAEDIFPDFLDKAAETARGRKLVNVAFVQGSEASPNLPENGVDVALALDSYHHWDYPEKMLAALHQSLKTGGRLVVVDYYRSENAMPNRRALQHIRIDKPGVIQEIEAGRFRLVSEHDHVPDSQYMAVFEKK